MLCLRILLVAVWLSDVVQPRHVDDFSYLDGGQRVLRPDENSPSSEQDLFISELVNNMTVTDLGERVFRVSRSHLSKCRNDDAYETRKPVLQMHLMFGDEIVGRESDNSQYCMKHFIDSSFPMSSDKLTRSCLRCYHEACARFTNWYNARLVCLSLSEPRSNPDDP